tara:strand:+ start:1210 stop:2418 length:1209 start_codon:yes stop_codon:yes gene_type:complete
VVGHYLTPVLRKTIIEIINESKRYLEGSELILIYWWPGVEKSELAKEASEKGITVHEIWMAGPINQAKIHGWYKNLNHYIDTNIKAFLKIQKIFRKNSKFNCALTIFHTPWYAEFLALLAARPRKLAVKFFTSTEPFVPIHKKIALALNSIFLNRLIVNSNEAKKFAMSLGHIFSKISIMRNIDIVARQFDKYKSDGNIVRKEFGIDEKAILVGSVSRLDPTKGHKTLINCWKKVQERFPKSRLLIVGGSIYGEKDPYLIQLKKIVKDSNLEDSLDFAGLRENVNDFYAAMDILVHPSIFDLFPFTILEAQSMKIPVISTKVGTIPQMISNGKEGILVEEENENELADAIIKLIKNKNERKIMGENGYKRNTKTWTAERAAKSCINLYNDVIERKWTKDYEC